MTTAIAHFLVALFFLGVAGDEYMGKRRWSMIMVLTGNTLIWTGFALDAFEKACR